mgnify:CR=1 FL=1
MIKRINWEQEANKAAAMDTTSLRWAFNDCVETANIWHRTPELDADQNGPFYSDLASVIYAEIKKRAE